MRVLFMLAVQAAYNIDEAYTARMTYINKIIIDGGLYEEK
jgi:hypothetical protein